MGGGEGVGGLEGISAALLFALKQSALWHDPVNISRVCQFSYDKDLEDNIVRKQREL